MRALKVKVKTNVIDLIWQAAFKKKTADFRRLEGFAVKNAMDRLERMDYPKLGYTFDAPEQKSFVETALNAKTIDELDYMLTACFADDAEQKMRGIISFSASRVVHREGYYNVEKGGYLQANEIIDESTLRELFKAISFGGNIPHDIQLSLNVQFYANIFGWNYRTAFHQHEKDKKHKEIVLRAQSEIETDFFDILRTTSDTKLLEDMTDSEKLGKVAGQFPSQLREEVAIALANYANRCLRIGKPKEGLLYMALGLQLARSLNWQFKEAEALQWAYAAFLYKSGMKQLVRYMLETGDIIIAPFESHKALKS